MPVKFHMSGSAFVSGFSDIGCLLGAFEERLAKLQWVCTAFDACQLSMKAHLWSGMRRLGYCLISPMHHHCSCQP
eukprot:5295509-Amphidinium_carterae.1